jgi:hypothetical protein
MNTKAAAIIGLMEALAATDPVRSSPVDFYHPNRLPGFTPLMGARRREEAKAKARRKMAAKSRKINWRAK